MTIAGADFRGLRSTPNTRTTSSVPRSPNNASAVGARRRRWPSRQPDCTRAESRRQPTKDDLLHRRPSPALMIASPDRRLRARFVRRARMRWTRAALRRSIAAVRNRCSMAVSALIIDGSDPLLMNKSDAERQGRSRRRQSDPERADPSRAPSARVGTTFLTTSTAKDTAALRK